MGIASFAFKFTLRLAFKRHRTVLLNFDLGENNVTKKVGFYFDLFENFIVIGRVIFPELLDKSFVVVLSEKADVSSLLIVLPKILYFNFQ